MDQPILQTAGGDVIAWLSPLSSDQFAEYRDGSFLQLIGKPELEPTLKKFWPSRGPQWDALGKTSQGDILLVEAKAHVAEMCSPATTASAESRSKIETALDEVAKALGANAGRAAWTEFFYQIANRIAHLHFLRVNGMESWLVFVNFLGDREMGGPTTPEAWEAAYQVAFHVMGLRKNHPLSRFIIHVYPNVGDTRGR
ncbi:MAG TPA: hypothetical protein VGJ56_15375 [Reyranella sp.]